MSTRNSDDPADREPAIREGREVLVVDDSQALRNLMTSILADAGYPVCEAESAAEGLAVVTSRDIWVVIADLNLGRGVKGSEFLDNLRVLRPGTKGILMSGECPGTLAEIPFPVLLKPFRAQELLALLQNLEEG